MTEIDNLKAVLSKARDLIAANRLVLGEYSGVKEVMEVEKAIDAALAEPVPEPLAWHRVYNSRSKYYAMKRELICFVEHSDSSTECRWHVTLANGKQDHIFRQGVAETVEQAKADAEKAMGTIR